MKKNTLRKLVTAALLTAAVSLTGCSQAPPQAAGTETSAPALSAATSAAAAEAAGPETAAASDAETAANLPAADDTIVRIGSLKGPTSMGLVSLMENAGNGNTASNYEFTIVSAADELLGKMVNSELDIALIPANVASVLYNRTQGGISVLDINTLGVLYIVSANGSIRSIADLKGQTIYLPGKGNVPDYVLRYLLAANGVDTNDVTLEYKSEPTEIAAILAEQPDAIALLQQPFVTVALAQNESLDIILDCTKEWEALQGDSGNRLLTGVTIVRNDFLNGHEGLVRQFLDDHLASTEYANTNPAEAAEWIAKAGIVEKAPIALKALPYCNIVCITGEEMKSALSGYLEVLSGQDLAAIGGALPGDGFYYTRGQ